MPYQGKPSRYARLGSGAYAVYVIPDQQGAPLYIGATARLRQRLYEHAQGRAWWNKADLDAITVEWFDNAHAAAQRERELIREHTPAHNRRGVDLPAMTYPDRKH